MATPERPLVTWRSAEPLLFLRLLGMAYAALGVGYILGLLAWRRGTYPATVVWTGIVSNGGACLVLCLFALHGAWAGWGPFASAVLWGSLVATGAIAAGLIAFGVCRR